MSSAVSGVDAQSSSPAADAALVAAITDLHVTFRRNGRDVHALRGVSLDIAPGEILGLVGESGSGKSVLGFTMLGLVPQGRVQGSVKVAGTDMVTGDAQTLRKVRRLDLGAIFQDPMTSLNPTMRIGKQVAEAAGSDEEALALLTAVGIPEPTRRFRAYPHELSGGLRQRVMTAIAIAGNPELIIADEPTTALDVTCAGAGVAAAAATARRNRLQHSVHHPRPRCRRSDLGSRCGALRRPYRRDRAHSRGSQPACPPLHPWTAAVPADPGYRQAPQARFAGRVGAQPGGPVAGVASTQRGANAHPGM